MPEKSLGYLRQFSFNSGLNQNPSAYLIKEDELTEAVNVDLSEIGIIQPSKGYLPYGPTLEANKTVLGLNGFFNSSNVGNIFATINSSDDLTSNIWEISDSFKTLLASGKSASKRAFGESYFNYFYWVNGQNNVATCTDDKVFGTVNVVGAPRGKYIAQYKNRIYITGNAEHPYRVYKSSNLRTYITEIDGEQSGFLTELNVFSTRYLHTGMVLDIYDLTGQRVVDSTTIVKINSETQITVTEFRAHLYDRYQIYLENSKGTISTFWDNEFYRDKEDGDWVDVLTEDNEPNIGFGTCANMLLIFKNNSMHRYEDSGTPTCVSYNIGAVNQRSIASTDIYLTFLHSSGWYLYDGRYPTLISKRVEKYIKGIGGTNEVSTTTSSSSTSTSSSSTSSSSTSTSSSSTSTTSTSSSSTSTTTATTTSTSTSTTSSSTSSSSTSTSTSTILFVEDTSKYNNICSIAKGTKSYLFIESPIYGDTTGTNVVLEYNIAMDNLVVRDNIPARVFMLFKDEIYFGSTDGNVYQFDTGYTVGDNAIDFSAATKDYLLDEPETKKIPRYIFVYSDVPGFNLQFKIDGGSWQSFQGGSYVKDKVQRFEFDPTKSFYAIRFRIHGTTSQAVPKIKGFSFAYTLGGVEYAQ